MPLYEYKCRQCGQHFEKIVKFSDAPLETCEVCSGPLDRLLSSPAFHFKGTGWYVTDYARKSAETGNGKEKKVDVSPKEGKSEGDKGDKGDKAEKPAAKTDPKPSTETKA